MTEEKLESTMSLLRGVLDYESFRNVDLVIKAAIEDVSLKQQIFAELEKYCLPYCMLAGNTSTIDLTIIGFAVNRMFFPYTQAALLLVERGTNPYRIDNVITKFGMPMGPFRLADLVGFGVAIYTGMQFLENFPERAYKSMLIPILQEDKRAGEVVFWADSLGSNHICSRLDEWSKTYGDFFKPCPYLAERAAKGIPLVRNSELHAFDYVC
ncbi:hypothetical protein NL676_029985 [Syzygium grande]|nr:hypothetical protein NL676_029985 [Syzygium grande]